VRRVIDPRVAALLCRSLRDSTRMRPAIDATLRGHKLTVAIFLRAALVISWADILGRRSSRKHFALALVMQSIKR
jgi:hypothetical protein